MSETVGEKVKGVYAVPPQWPTVKRKEREIEKRTRASPGLYTSQSQIVSTLGRDARTD